MPDISQDQQEANALRIKQAFGDGVALDFLRLRGIEGERAREEVIERHQLRQSGIDSDRPTPPAPA